MLQEIKVLIDTLNGLKSTELKNWCNIYNIKKSRNGVSNKYVLKLNIFKYEIGRKPTSQEEYLML